MRRIYTSNQARQFVGKLLSIATVLAVVFWSFGQVLPVIAPAEAAISTNSATNLTVPSQTIKAASSTTALLGINTVQTASETLNRLEVELNGANGFTLSDLAAFGTTGASGLALFKDNKAGGQAGSFDSTDTAVTLTNAPQVVQSSEFAKLTGLPTAAVTDMAMSITTGDIVYANVTANAAPTGTYAWHIVTTGATGVAASTLRLDGAAAAPTYAAASQFTDLSQASTGSYIINATANTATPALASGDIVFYQTSTLAGRWGMVTGTFDATNAPVDGANLANATYTITKIAGSTASFTVSGTAAITPSGGAYMAPAVGDIVLYQSGITPAGWGVITNAALTSGTFAINGVPLTDGTYQISKTGSTFASAPTNDQALVISTGELAFALTTNAPQTDAYAWHMVTTGATGVTGNSLRLDGVSAAPSYGWVVTLTPAAGQAVPANDTGPNAGADYFVTARTANTPTNGHAFSVGIIPGDITYSANTPSNTPMALTTNTITIDTAPPTISGAFPISGATNIPVSSLAHVNFSEILDRSTVTPSNVTFGVQGGAAIPFSLRVFPNGFDLVPSSPPAYTAGSLWAQPFTNTPGFYFSQGTGSIQPNGPYNAPSAGDIVFFQQSDFPSQVGIVTNATLTAGTFSVNDLALQGGYQITKFTSPSATGLASSATVLTTGDVVVAFPTANPAGTRYAWHMVTTGAAMNAATLRLDGAASQPTFAASSRISGITPTHTSAVGGSGNTITAGIALTQGDLLYANVSANADNTGGYAWHLVTTAETITAGAAPSALRLDGAAAAPTFAAGSQISSFTPVAKGAVTDSTPTFALGGIIFTSLTSGGQNLNAYAFHQVSGDDVPNGSNLRFDNASTPLTPSTTYAMVVGTGVKDFAGNALASAATITFTTGTTGTTNTTPPFVSSSVPAQGTQAFPIAAPITLTFSQDMSTSGGASGANSVLNPVNVGLFVDNFGAPGAAVSATNTYDTATKTVTITPGSSLSASTGYIVQVTTAAQSATGTSFPQPFFLNFMSASGADTQKPHVTGVFPAVNAANVPLPLGDVGIGFSEAMDASTINATNITISPALSAVVTYNPKNHTAHISPTVAAAASTTYTVTLSQNVHDLSGNSLEGNGGVANAVTTTTNTASDYVYTFGTSATSDSTAPSVSSSNADNFSIAITYSESMKTGGANGVDNIVNYSLESPVGSSVSLSGKTVIYDAPSQTARITGLSLQNGVGYKVTVSNLAQDLAGNSIDTSGTPAHNVAQGTVQSATATGGLLGPGSGVDPMSDPGKFGITPTNVFPMSRVAGATSKYHVEFPVQQSIPLGGSIVLTFPTGFDVSGAAAATAGTESFANGDINGPATGTVTIASVTADNGAHTLTITTAGAATGAPGFISLDLKSIVNSTVPSFTGYTVTISTRDTSAVQLESLTSAPFFLGQAGTASLAVTVFNDNGAGGGTAGDHIKNGTEAGIGNARVFLFSPGTGGQQATTNASGVATFSNLIDDSYMVGLDPSSAGLSGGGFIVNAAPQNVTVSGPSNYAIGAQASALTISGNLTGPANTALDVFASSQTSGFSKVTVTLDGTGSGTYSLPAQSNTTYSVGVGPAVPVSFSQPGAPPPPPPTFTFMPPPNQTVSVASANVSGVDFTMTSASKTITGTVLDSSAAGLSNAGVFARPVKNATNGGSAVGFGTSGRTDTSGNFTLNVVPGVYLVGVFKPGMPQGQEQQIIVPASGTNSPSTLSFVLDAATTLTISGSVTDTSGNPIAYSGVSARKVVSTSNLAPVGGAGQNFVGGQTDANGQYTLYVSAGTWVIEAYAPGYGKLGTKTVTVTTTSLSGQDFSAGTLQIGTISGAATKAGAGQPGVIVRASGAAGQNMAITDAQGSYALKVPAGTYTVTCVFPGVGQVAPLTGITVTANATTSNHNCAIATPITITVNITDGTNPIGGAFVDVRDASGNGNSVSESTTSGANAVYTVTVPPGTYTVRAGSPLYGMIGTTASVNSTRTITYTASAGKTYAVTGTVQANGSALANAWASVFGTPTGQTNVVNLGAQTDASGHFSINVPAGSYKVQAGKPGYLSPAPTSLTLTSAAADVGTITLSAATNTISGTVTLNGTAVANAFVDAGNGSAGFAVAQTDKNGAYTLSVGNGTWQVRAHSIGYQGGPLFVTVNNANVAGKDITLSAISGFTLKAQQQETITPTAGGLVTNSNLGTGFKLDIPANALGTDSNASTLLTQANTNLPNASNAKVFVANGVAISATNSGGQPIKSLIQPVTVTLPYDPTQLPTGASATDLVLGTYNSATNNYDTLPTTVDATLHTLTATVSHFSDFAPLLPTAGAPDTPTGLAASDAGTGTSVNLTWSAVSGAATYDIYKSTDNVTFPLLASVSTNAYTATGLTVGTTYYFKVSSLNAGSNESAASAAVSVAPASPSTGGSSSGGVALIFGGGSSTSAAPTSTATATSTSTSTSTNTAANTSSSSSAVTPTSSSNTSSGASGPRLIKSAGSPKVYVIENGKKTWIPSPAAFAAAGYHWQDIQTVTDKTLANYPDATAVSSQGPQLLRVQGNPKVYVIKGGTREWVPSPAAFAAAGYHWQDVRVVSPSVLEAYPPAGPTVSAAPATFSPIAPGTRSNAVKAFQQFLKDQGRAIYPEGLVTGYYGRLTRAAVERFQVKYGIAGPGHVGYGVFGPQTSAKANAVAAGQ